MMTHPSEHAGTRSASDSWRLELELERNLRAPSLARATLARRCEELDLEASLVQSLILLVSEVVSNAVRHSPGPRESPIELVAASTGETIRITVTDAGSGFTPRPRDPSGTSDGYGLYLLEKVATSWGVDSDGDTKVWFELPLAV
jgi:anti-sigma regulatory factor (Ser/Thr protein kinase)